MAGKLTEDDKNDLSAFLKSVKDSLISPITPELLRDGIERIKKANTDSNQEISHKEIVDYLAGNINTSILNMPKVEKDCNMVALHTHLPKPETILAKENALVSLSDQSTVSIGVIKEIAGLVKTPAKKQELTDKFAGIASYMTENNLAVPPDYRKETLEFISPEIREISKAAVRNVENILKAHPDIKRDLQNLPDTTAIHITANHVCQALTGPYTPSPKIQATKKSIGN